MTTKKVQTKTPHELLVEQLAVLSADIPARVGKQARDFAVSKANNLIREAKIKLRNEFDEWLGKRLLSVVPKDMKELYENYITMGSQMTAHIRNLGASENSYVLDKYLKPMPLQMFLTGEYWLDSEKHRSKMEVFYQKIKGYQTKKDDLKAKMDELDHMLEDVRRAVFRSYKSKTAQTQSGEDLAIAVDSLVKSALGVNLLAAPKTVDCEVVLA